MNDSREITLGNCTMSAVDILQNRPVSNAWDLLVGVGDNPFAAAMRACRVGEAFVTGGASDYDKFSALCSVISQMGGHPLCRRAHRLIHAVCGCDLPINEANCAAIWCACAEVCAGDGLGVRDVLYPLDVRTVYVAERPDADLSAYAVQTDCMRIVPLFDPSALLDPAADGFARAMARLGDIGSVDGLTAALGKAAERFADAGCDRMRISAPPFAFERPHPYRADQILKAYRDHADEPPEIDAYASQMLRVLGEIAVKHGWQMMLADDYIENGEELLAYLDGCDRLPRTVYAPSWNPWIVSELAGRYGLISIGMTADRDTAVGMLRKGICDYATHAPIGSLAGMEIAVTHPLDVLILDDANEVLDTLTREWRAGGLAPTDACYTVRSIKRSLTRKNTP